MKNVIETFFKVAGGETTTYTVKSWLESWLIGRTDASKATIVEYRRIINLFVKFLGARAGRPLTTLQPKQIEDFKQSLLIRVAPSTVNKAIKVLRASFANAVAKRQMEFSPAEHVQAIDVEETNRRPFTDKELGKLLQKAEGDWLTMIYLGYYTGQRLGDCANLTAGKVDILTQEIKLRTEKTGRAQAIPIHPVLLQHLENLPSTDDPSAALCRSLFGKPSSWLSARFYKLMVEAGLAEKRGHESSGKGRDGRRDGSRISFHSLRYNTTSALKSAGVSDSVAMDIVGHDTEAASHG